MSDRDNLNRDTRHDSDRHTTGGREKSKVDKLIDKAQEKGVFEKAERFVKDKLGGRKRR